MSEKFFLKNQDVSIHFDYGIETSEDHAYAIYVFVGDELVSGTYGTYDNMRLKYDSIREKLNHEV